MMSLHTLLSLTTTLALALAPSTSQALNIPRQANNGTAGIPTIGSTETYTGDITFYNTLGGNGACGDPLADTQAIAAVNTLFYDQYTVGANPNNNRLCGTQIELTYTDPDSGAVSSATVAIKDRCTGCAPTDIDLTPTVFDQLVPKGQTVGRTTASWKFV